MREIQYDLPIRRVELGSENVYASWNLTFTSFYWCRYIIHERKAEFHGLTIGVPRKSIHPLPCSPWKANNPLFKISTSSESLSVWEADLTFAA